MFSAGTINSEGQRDLKTPANVSGTAVQITPPPPPNEMLWHVPKTILQVANSMKIHEKITQ